MNQLISLILFSFILTACGPKPWDEPPLHDAALRGNVNTVQTLLAEGTKVDSKNKQGATPLHWAAFKGHVEVAKILLKKGADINAETTKGSTPLRLATTHKHTDMIRYLKSQGARE
ncbi:ankyrin repeat domain-containing protein [Algibacillus agarilyticus]|uniref:ankyrin repeat domain-containing protein n=1 Tax=Algibacillus agarilyticus TaxID=2234133 RepID=UPI000DD07A52|nr:ankyrin repeat domain-containing protein [Algibacillus agarilyticus]